ncbi:hypothetical protein ACFWWS_40075, partial [Streptomyces sp. NPDC059083]|uniref:hypothetical protein n=1 Tax=Streptomyces sp. NPDC059083 TaxID=3346721 RepID=UPI003691EF87
TYRGSGGPTVGSIYSPTSMRINAVGPLYSVYVNGSSSPADTWNDSGGIVPINSTTRYFGIVGSSKDTIGTATRGYGLDSWTGKDF